MTPPREAPCPLEERLEELMQIELAENLEALPTPETAPEPTPAREPVP